MDNAPGSYALHSLKLSLVTCAVLLVTLVAAPAAHAQTLGQQQRLCDPEYQDCRADILTYIAQEQVEIDMGFWLMDDARYSNALVAAWKRGVKIRLLMDPRCITEHSACSSINDQLSQAGLPMRNRNTSGILHWKLAIFASQGQVEFAGANYAPFELTPETPYQNYTDEVICFTNDPSLVHSFMRKFDDLWTDTNEFVNYANANIPLVRSYPTYSIDPQLNFPPDDSYRSRALNAYAAESTKIDVFMFRITDEQESDGMIAALNRGVPIRLVTDETEYRNPGRLWDAYNVDKMYHAGVQVRLDGHQGINHEKAVILYGTHTSIFGSSNWTSPSSDSQREHNMFTTQSWVFDWLVSQFERKWNNQGSSVETQVFTPLPPDPPVYNTPANAATGVATSGVSLSWNAGLWGQQYDIYFGTSANPPLLASNQKLGPSQSSTDYRTYLLTTALQPGTTYYWKIVSKTMAFVTAAGPVWSFTTAGTAPNNQPPSVSITSPANGASFAAPATVTINATASDSDGTVTKVDFYSGNTLLGTDTASPYTFTWSNVAGGNYVLTAVATDNGGATTTSAAVSITVTGGGSTLPPGWSDADIGAVGAAGSASYSGGTFSVTGAGADVWGTADALNYAYQSLTGNGSIVARVVSIQNVSAWTKAGVMMRNSLSPSAAQGFMLVAASSSKGTPFQRRLADGASSVSTSGAFVTAPYWVKLDRSGNMITASESADGTNWTTVASDNFTMGSTILVGLGVSSHVAGTPATATFDHVTVSSGAPANNPPTVALTSPANAATFTAPATVSIAANASDTDGTVAKVDFYANSTLLGTSTTAPYGVTWSNAPAGTYSLTAVATDNGGATTTSGAVSITISNPSSTLPTGWADSDIGAVPFAGNASFSGGTFTVTGSGADIWNNADAFHYAYRTMTGNGTMIARVASVQNVATWVKAGVMIRETLDPGSTHALILVSAAKGVAFQRRDATGGASVSTTGSLANAPHWVKLTRSGNTFSAYESADGVTWTLVGTDNTIVMGSTVYVGLAVTSHTSSASATCTFDNVSFQ